MSIINSATADGGAPRGPETLADWLRLIAAEYREIPGLCLTRRQAGRLWNLDAITSETVLEVLETSGVLRRTRTGAYVLADA
jgi:hypothetical protein